MTSRELYKGRPKDPQVEDILMTLKEDGVIPQRTSVQQECIYREIANRSMIRGIVLGYRNSADRISMDIPSREPARAEPILRRAASTA